MQNQTPQIVVSKVGKKYGIIASGKFGGGYSIPPSKTLEEVAAILARDWRSFDCGDEPIIITAPNEVRELAGLPPVLGRPSVGDVILPAINVPSDLKGALEKKAGELNITVPDLRRKAYDKICE